MNTDEMSPGQPPAQIDLSRYRWQNRLLLFFAPSRQDAAYQQQLAHFRGEEGELNERDLVSVHLFDREPGQVGDAAIDSEQTTALYRAFDIAPEQFTLLLVGKDGTVKARYTEPTEPSGIYALIDSMPMRRREMREAGRKYTGA
jgi:hypothetical protein